MPGSIHVHFFTLTDTNASEHIYMAELADALTDREIVAVDDWREADVVHLFEVNFYSRAALSEFQYPKLLRILRSGTPVVVSTDDLYFIDRPELTARPRLYPLNHRTQRWLLDQCDAVVAISESVRSALAEYVPDSKLHVAQHGVNPEYENADPPDDPPFVLHVSIAAKRKNPDAIIETGKRIDAPFVVAGSGWCEHFENVSDTKNVDIRGYVPEAELVDLYHRAAVFYFPTRHEGFGLPVLEAMAAGCAIVTSNCYSVPEVADDAALLFDPDDTQAHVDAIRELLDVKDRRTELAAAARERAQQFSWDDAAAETISVYRSVLDGYDEPS